MGMGKTGRMGWDGMGWDGMGEKQGKRIGVGKRGQLRVGGSGYQRSLVLMPNQSERCGRGRRRDCR